MSDFQRDSTALSNLRMQLNNLSTKKVILVSEKLTLLSQNLALINKLEIKDTNEKLRELRAQIGNLEENEFSFFNILGVQENELVHSNFLAWLLTTSGNHGLGTGFIEKMLALLASKNPSISLEGIDPAKLVIRREESGEKGRLDLRIFDPNGLFQCIIENKINSTEGDSQTQRYYEEWSGYYERELFVFLTLDPKQKPMDNKNYICLNYKEILKLLNQLQPDSIDTKFLMKNYIHTLEGLIMAEKFQDFSDRSKLYFQFYKEIQDVSKAWDEDRKLILTTLETGTNRLFVPKKH